MIDILFQVSGRDNPIRAHAAHMAKGYEYERIVVIQLDMGLASDWLGHGLHGLSVAEVEAVVNGPLLESLSPLDLVILDDLGVMVLHDPAFRRRLNACKSRIWCVSPCRPLTIEVDLVMGVTC